MAPAGPTGLRLLVLLLPLALGRVQQRTLRIGPTPGEGRIKGKPWHYLAKFGFATGIAGRWGLRAQLASIGPVPGQNMTFESYLDEDWPNVEAVAEKCDRGKLAKRQHMLEVGPKGQWGPWINGSVRQTVRPHLWYYAVSVCNGSRIWDRSYRVKFEFVALQPDGSHFSYEQSMMPLGNMLALAFLTAFLLLFCMRVRRIHAAEDSVHPVIWTLTAVLVLQYLAQALHTGHLLLFSRDGKGAHALEVGSEIFFVMSQMCQTSLLILIGLGYTLLQSGLGELDLMIPLYMIVGVVHVLLVIVVKLQDEAAHRFHEYEGALGWVLLVLRLLLFVWFIWATRGTAAEAGYRLKCFLQRFTFAGSLYFLSYPAIFLLVDFFAPYLRAPIMASGQMTMQMASQVWLSYLFLNKGEYFKVSTLSTSILPGSSPVNSLRYKDE